MNFVQDIIFLALQFLVIIVPLLLCVAYLTLAERKLIGAIQRRRGPNVIGYYGLLQPLADGLKLFVKEGISPSNANNALFLLAPLLTFFLSLIGWAVIPFGPDSAYADVDCGLLYLFAVSSLGVYGIILSGWASNSKYAFLGCLRSAAQIVSYEVCIGFVFATIVIIAGSTDLNEIIDAQEGVWNVCFQYPIYGVFLVCMLAETNRHPFDLPEAEAELVSGYNVEYSAIGFALFFLGEYANILLMSSFAVVLFWGGWISPLTLVYEGQAVSWNLEFFDFEPSAWFWFSSKVTLHVIFFVLVRAGLPRYRYDQLINLGWKKLLPFTLGWMVFTYGVLLFDNALPI